MWDPLSHVDCIEGSKAECSRASLRAGFSLPSLMAASQAGFHLRRPFSKLASILFNVVLQGKGRIFFFFFNTLLCKQNDF